MKNFTLLASVITLALFNTPQVLADNTPTLFGFHKHTLVSLSDADMVASAYTDGKLRDKEGHDVLSIITFDSKGKQYQLREVPASNSVGGPPMALSLHPSGHYAYIIETFGERPADNDNLRFSDLPIGQQLIIYDIRSPQDPQRIATHIIPKRPESVDVSADGKWLLISFYPEANGQSVPLGIYAIHQGDITQQYYPDIPHWDPKDRLISVKWHPKRSIFATINQTRAEVAFYQWDPKNTRLRPWGNTVSVGKSPFIGHYSQDGHHFLVNNLYWGSDVQGTWNEAPNGTIVNIALDVDADKSLPKPTIRHALNAQVMVGPSPEGFALSPDGKFVVSANMERSWLPNNDPRQNGYSSLTLIKRDPKSGAMQPVHTLPHDGILPESLVFDANSQHIAMTTFDHYNPKEKGGSIDFFRIVNGTLNTQQHMLMPMRNRIKVTRGAHNILSLPTP